MNDQKRATLNRAIKKAEKSKKPDDVRGAMSLIGKAVKTHMLHKNKGARLTSQLAKLIAGKPVKKAPAPKKKTKVKTAKATRGSRLLPRTAKGDIQKQKDN